MKIEELQIELRKLDTKLQEIRAQEEHTPEDVKSMNAICDQMEEISNKLEAEERAAKLSASLKGPEEDPPVEQPDDTAQRGFAIPSDATEEQRNQVFGEYLQAVARANLPRDGSEIGGKPCGVVDERLYQSPETRSTGLEESTPSLGGFLVGTDFASDLLTRTHQTSLLFNKVRKVPISSKSNSLKMYGVDETSRADGSRWGGVRMYWLEEGGTKTATKPKFRLIELDLKKLTGLCYSTDELLQDSAALGTYINQAFSEEFAFKIDDSILNGSGAGQPVGLLNAACTVSQAKETGQPAATIYWDNIKKMYSRLHAGSRTNMIWLANQDCLPQLMSMTNPVGTGGVPVWLPANGAYGLSHDTLLGRPIIYPEQCQTVGTVGDLYLVDLSQYMMITKGGLQTASSIHVQFTTDETVFRFVYRIDGQPLWGAALVPFKGAANTQSPFITLATRS